MTPRGDSVKLQFECGVAKPCLNHEQGNIEYSLTSPICSFISHVIYEVGFHRLCSYKYFHYMVLSSITTALYDLFLKDYYLTLSCMCARMCACLRACVHACVRACVRACVCTCKPPLPRGISIDLALHIHCYYLLIITESSDVLNLSRHLS